MNYNDVQRFYLKKYGKTIGALKFKVYMLKKRKNTKQTLNSKVIRTRRVNLFVF